MVIEPAIRQKQLNILSNLFAVNKEITDEYEAQKLINNQMRQLREEHNLDTYNITTYIKDNTLINWKHSRGAKNEFIKVFVNEIESLRELQSLKRSEVLFLYSLSPYLSWCENLLVDKDGYPLNQKQLCKELDLNRKTIYNNIKSLEQHKCLIRIWDGRDVYIMVNPYLMFKGDKINKAIPKLFEMIGYKELN